MPVKQLLVLAAALAAALGSDARACDTKFDCAVGSSCVHTDAFSPGVCLGGMFPGNSDDSGPRSLTPISDGTRGKTCSFDTECDVGQRCLKSGLYGACL